MELGFYQYYSQNKTHYFFKKVMPIEHKYTLIKEYNETIKFYNDHSIDYRKLKPHQTIYIVQVPIEAITKVHDNYVIANKFAILEELFIEEDKSTYNYIDDIWNWS